MTASPRPLPGPRTGSAGAGAAAARPAAADVDAAAGLLTSVIGPTPLQRNARLSELTGFDVWLKREDLTAVRSYKVRGAYSVISGLDDAARARGVACASAGNHAQGVAYACAHAGVHATIFLPRTTPRQKRDRVATLGGEFVDIVIAGEAYDDAASACASFAEASGATVVPAFDHPGTVAGQGTVAVEIVEQARDAGIEPSAIVVPVGGGGLLAGIATYVAERAPGLRLIAAEPAGAASLAAALGAGGPVDLPSVEAFVDGAAVRRVGEVTYACIDAARATVALSVHAVPEGLVCVEMLDLYQADGIIAEPAGALSSAGLRALVQDSGESPDDLPAPGSTVVCVVSGGNNDVSRYGDVVERALVYEGVKHYFLVEFPQEPGALRRFLDEVLGPDDDIALFEYTKRNNRETGPALVGIELGDPGELDGLLQRMRISNIRVEKVDPDSPLFGFVL